VRVLTITSSYPKYVGDTTAPFIESITRELASRGHRLTVVLPARDDLHPAPIDGVRFRPYRYAPLRALQVFGYAEALRADVALRGATYCVLPLAALSGVLALLAEARRESYDVVHAHWVVPSGALAAVALGGSALPLVVSVHGSDVFLSERSRVVGAGARAAFRRAAAATACSRDLAERSAALGASEPTVIPYGVDTAVFGPGASPGREAELRKKLGLAADGFVVFAAGRLVHKKGFEFLVDATGELTRRQVPLELVIAGRGDLEEELRSRARALGVDGRVRLVGNVERNELPSYFALADVVAVPSVRDPAGNVDGLPNVLLEAMSSERAIVATRLAGIPDALRDGKEGILVSEKSPKELADAIERLARDAELRRALARRARRRVEEEFSWRHAGERFESVLRAVAEARRS
jgi:glycosyltransferase involved in cell wall biosynthesis